MVRSAVAVSPSLDGRPRFAAVVAAIDAVAVGSRQNRVVAVIAAPGVDCPNTVVVEPERLQPAALHSEDAVSSADVGHEACHALLLADLRT